MRTFLYGIMEGFARIHAWILTLNDGFEGSFNDKELHFLVVGGMSLLLFLVVDAVFKRVAKRSIPSIAVLYTFTVVVVLVFAIEIGQHQSRTGHMEFLDIVYGLYGFFVFVGGYLLLAFLWRKTHEGIRKRHLWSKKKNAILPLLKGGPFALPGRVPLAHLPTPLQFLERLSGESGHQIFVKRDDFTGIEVSGNKVRKLEFALYEAQEQGAQVLITCGGLQSNHARATAATARKMGLQCHLVLRGKSEEESQGNLLLNALFGAKKTFLSQQAFQSSHEAVMEDLKAEYDAKGTPGYILPLGASNAIGTFGYLKAYEEILAQEGPDPFDAIYCAVGSGGTMAGLVLGNILHGRRHKIVGVPVSGTSADFKGIVEALVKECLLRLGIQETVQEEDLLFLDGYAGRGYALTTPEELAFLESVAMKEGLLLDPVYTNKAFRGMMTSLHCPPSHTAQRVLFIHTGGQFGLFPMAADFAAT